MLPQEEACPVPESLLGDLYRASPEGLHGLVETIPSRVRAMLAVYCYRRGHLASLGLAIAATCDKVEMTEAGGQFGAVIFEQSRQAPEVVPEKRRKVTLPTRSSLQLVIAQDLI
jgi:hypothetical protein